jgi:hypothetical protein
MASCRVACDTPAALPRLPLGLNELLGLLLLLLLLCFLLLRMPNSLLLLRREYSPSKQNKNKKIG